jgi:hypothetical protein
VLPTAVKPVTSYFLRDGRSLTYVGSTEIERLPKLPWSLKISKPVIGQPFVSGSVHLIVMLDEVVDTFSGAGKLSGFKQA